MSNPTSKDIVKALAHDPKRQRRVAASLGYSIPKRDPGLPKQRYRSEGERLYAGQLALREVAGEIRGWRYEPFKLLLADGATYRIDFLVWLSDGSVELVEFKGHEREDDTIKFKVAAEQNPWFIFRMVKRIDGQFVTTRLLNARPGGSVRT